MYWIVINNNKNQLVSHADKYRLFDDKTKAYHHARSLGFETMFGDGVDEISNKYGMASVYMCGEVDILILPTIIEV